MSHTIISQCVTIELSIIKIFISIHSISFGWSVRFDLMFFFFCFALHFVCFFFEMFPKLRKIKTWKCVLLFIDSIVFAISFSFGICRYSTAMATATFNCVFEMRFIVNVRRPWFVCALLIECIVLVTIIRPHLNTNSSKQIIYVISSITNLQMAHSWSPFNKLIVYIGFDVTWNPHHATI